MSLSTLRSFLPDADLKRSPYRLYPYRNSKLLEPEGQVDLVCERQDGYVTLTFEILPDSSIRSKPALLPGSDSERLGLIIVHADEIHTLSSEVETTTAEHENLQGIQCSRLRDVASHHVETIPETKFTMACNHL